MDQIFIDDKKQFESDWRETFSRYEHDPKINFLVLLVDKVPVGYVCIRILKNGAFIDDLFVAPGSRNQGIARRLIAESITWAKQQGVTKMNLAVARANPSAIALYKHVGFHQEPSEYLDFSLDLT